MSGIVGGNLGRGSGLIKAGAIDDNSVTLAKMAGGTDGNLISYDTSGDPVAVATGNDGQVLTSAGAGAVCLFEDAAGGNNTPAFQVYFTGDQTVSHNTLTKVAMTGEIVDTDSAYDNSTNYRFTVPASEGGKYFFFWRIFCHVNGSPVTGANVPLYKNGSAYTGTGTNWGVRIDDSNGFDYLALSGSYIVDLDATDYVELYAKALTVDSSSSVLLTANALGFGGYKLIGA